MNLIERLEKMAALATQRRYSLATRDYSGPLFQKNADKEAIETVRAMQEALRLILANANGRPMQTGYYDVPASSISEARKALRRAEGNAG